jgi:hypothetical protein
MSRKTKNSEDALIKMLDKNSSYKSKKMILMIP